MHLPINVESPNNIIKWQIGFNSAFKGLNNIRIGNSTQTILSLLYILTKMLSL
jgi:hypothetical protein